MSTTRAEARHDGYQQVVAGGPLNTEGPGARKKLMAIIGVMIGGWLFIMGMVVSYTEALADPAVNNVSIAAAGNADTIVTLQQNEDLDVTVVADDAAAQAEVTNRDADAAIVIPTEAGQEVKTYVATGASVIQARAVTAIGNEVAENLQTTNNTVDLAAPAENNPNGSLEFYLVIFLTIGASFGAAIFGRVLGTIRTASDFLARTVVLGVLSTVMAAGASFYAVQIYDGIIGEHGFAFFGALWLYTFAVSGAVTGIASLAGTLAAAGVSLMFVLVGNSASGGPFGVHMQNDFFQAMHWITPQGWGLELLRDIEYFDSNGIGRPLTALVIWAVIGLIAAFAGMLMHTNRTKKLEPEPTMDFNVMPAAETRRSRAHGTPEPRFEAISARAHDAEPESEPESRKNTEPAPHRDTDPESPANPENPTRDDEEHDEEK